MDKAPLFYRLGKFIYKRHPFILFLWFALILACLPFLGDLMTPFKTMGFVDNNSKSAKADRFLEKNLGYGNQRVVLTYSSDSLSTEDPLFLEMIKASLKYVQAFPIPHQIFYPSDDNEQFSKNKHHAYALILFKTKEDLSTESLDELRSLIRKPPGMSMHLGGEPIFIEDVNEQTKIDLFRADVIAAPVSIFIMILVFGSLVAALIPIALGSSCAVVILTCLYFFAQYSNLSIFTINISLLLGLCLSLDYALFFMSRFREELHKKLPIDVVIGTTMNTAGRAIFYSGVAVFISLSALLMFPVSILFSIGVGGLTAVFFAVMVSLILLPAVLSLLKDRVNRLPVKLYKPRKNVRFWRWLAEKVVKRPLLFFFPSLMFLLFLSLPFFNAKFGISDAHILPEHSESRRFLLEYKENFNEQQLTPIVLIASSEDKILSKQSLAKLHDLTEILKLNPKIDVIKSIVNVDKKLKLKDYHALYNLDKKYQPQPINQLLETTSGKYFTTLQIFSKYPINAPETKQLVKELKEMTTFKGLSLQVTGLPVTNLEVMETINKIFPYAMVWILGLTYLILLILLHSILLPFKAILMNIISLSASYGVLVFVFQEGHLQNVLQFVPQGMLDISLIIIIFCALFGFSMDYEVFLLTRMKEFYEKTKNTNQSVICGIDQSGRIITSAAIIVIVLCGSFMAAEVLMIKEFGLGIAIAIFVDAFLVRSLLEPTLMVLIGKWNWYIPKWLNRLLPKAYYN